MSQTGNLKLAQGAAGELWVVDHNGLVLQGFHQPVGAPGGPHTVAADLLEVAGDVREVKTLSGPLNVTSAEILSTPPTAGPDGIFVYGDDVVSSLAEETTRYIISVPDYDLMHFDLVPVGTSEAQASVRAQAGVIRELLEKQIDAPRVVTALGANYGTRRTDWLAAIRNATATGALKIY
jgi:hypothetical protein